MSQLNISNIIQISVSETPAGIGAYNTSNLALFTRETPLVSMSDGYKIYKSASDVATDFGSTSVTSILATSVFSQTPNILAGGGYLVVIPYLNVGETILAAIQRTKGLVQYFGIISEDIIPDSDLLNASDYVETLNKMLFPAKKLETNVSTGGVYETVQTRGNNKTRCLAYMSATATDTPALKFAAAYASRGLSVNFSGSNTTGTMHMKDLSGIDPDLYLDETVYGKCATVGADGYGSFQGVPKVFSNGANKFFDQVYNLCWFIGALEVAGFNAIAQSSTKLPQTEQGVGVLKGAYRNVCEQAFTNAYIAPGTWTSPDTFGNQEDFLRNIQERGYYIYSQPVSQQASVDRAARKCPLIQIGVKEAGAVHSSSVIVYVNS